MSYRVKFVESSFADIRDTVKDGFNEVQRWDDSRQEWIKVESFDNSWKGEQEARNCRSRLNALETKRLWG
jgi:hypothetical protein